MVPEKVFNSLANKSWLVIYTRPRWEKKVSAALQLRGIENYCPLRKVINQWADRKKAVELPLFNSYVFVKINYREELKVRQVQGVLNFIYYNGKPASIRETEIERIKEAILNCPEAEVVSLKNISVGDIVKIKNGLLSNHVGAVIKVQGKTVLMLLESLECALVSRVNADNLVLMN